MIKVLSLTLVGLIFSFVGFYVGYKAILEPDETKSLLMLVPSGILIITGVILLFKAGKSDAMIMTKAEKNTSQNLSTISRNSPVKTLKKNNELIAQWRKTMQQRDRMKMLELSSSDEHS